MTDTNTNSLGNCSNAKCSYPHAGSLGRCLTCNSLLIGKLVRNRCYVQCLVSRGGFGATYLVNDQDCFDELRILKELRPASKDNKESEGSESNTAARKEMAERLFKREAQTLLRLNHSGIPRLQAYFLEEGFSYLLQEYIPGATLAEEVADRNEAYSEAEARKLLGEIADILAYLHKHDPPIVHRDIKPQNLMRHQDGRLLLIDFGAVCRAANQSSHSQTLIGSPGYAPPEQALGQPVPQSDLYAAGATIVRLLTGIHPSQLTNSRTNRLDWQKHVNVCPPFADIINRLLIRDPSKRLPSAEVLRQELHSLAAIPPLPLGTGPALNFDADLDNLPTATIGELHNENTSEPREQIRTDAIIPDLLTALDSLPRVDTGSISQHPVPLLLFKTYQQGLSGRLVFNYRKLTKTIYFDHGTIVFAASSQKDERLSEHLVRSGRLSTADFERATKIVDETGRRMGEVLLQLNIITIEELSPLVVEHVAHIAYSLFDWTSGDYQFISEDPVVEVIKMPISTADIIFEGVRRLNNFEIIQQWLGDFTRPLCTTGDPMLLYQAVTLDPREGFIVSRIDSAMSIEDLLSLGGLPENETLRTVCGLISIGMLALADTGKRKNSPPVANVLAYSDPAPPDFDFSTAATFCYEVEGKLHSIENSDAYGILETHRQATEGEITEAYNRLARKYHPDKHSQLLTYNLSLRKDLEHIFTVVADAYEMLKSGKYRSRGTSPLVEVTKASRLATPNTGLPRANTASLANSASNAKTDSQWAKLGQEYYQKGSYDAARNAFNKAIELASMVADYHFQLARVLVHISGGFHEAEKEFYRALELSPENADYYAECGLFYQHFQLKEHARAMFNYCLGLNPNHPIALRSLQ